MIILGWLWWRQEMHHSGTSSVGLSMNLRHYGRWAWIGLYHRNSQLLRLYMLFISYCFMLCCLMIFYSFRWVCCCFGAVSIRLASSTRQKENFNLLKNGKESERSKKTTKRMAIRPITFLPKPTAFPCVDEWDKSAKPSDADPHQQRFSRYHMEASG